ncbi:MAG: hypothetical protein RSA12_11465, partial [Clostridia bacterium]
TVTSEDGTPLDMQKTYSVAVSENRIMKVDHVLTFSEAERQELPFTLREAVTAGIKAQGTITQTAAFRSSRRKSQAPRP